MRGLGEDPGPLAAPAEVLLVSCLGQRLPIRATTDYGAGSQRWEGELGGRAGRESWEPELGGRARRES